MTSSESLGNAWTLHSKVFPKTMKTRSSLRRIYTQTFVPLPVLSKSKATFITEELAKLLLLQLALLIEAIWENYMGRHWEGAAIMGVWAVEADRRELLMQRITPR